MLLTVCTHNQQLCKVQLVTQKKTGRLHYYVIGSLTFMKFCMNLNRWEWLISQSCQKLWQVDRLGSLQLGSPSGPW